RHTEVGSNGPFCYRFQLSIVECLCHLKRPLSIARSLSLLSQIDRQQGGQIDQHADGGSTGALSDQSQCVLQGCLCLQQLFLLPMGSTQTMGCLSRCVQVTFTQERMIRCRKALRGLCLFASQERCLAQAKQKLTLWS